MVPATHYKNQVSLSFFINTGKPGKEGSEKGSDYLNRGLCVRCRAFVGTVEIMVILIQGEGRKFKCLMGFKETFADGANQFLRKPLEDGSTAFQRTIGAVDAYS